MRDPSKENGIELREVDLSWAKARGRRIMSTVRIRIIFKVG